jgi:hypothetical protein
MITGGRSGEVLTIGTTQPHEASLAAVLRYLS